MSLSRISRRGVADGVVLMSSMSVVVERAVSRFHPQRRLLANIQSTSSDCMQPAFTASIIYFQTYTHLHQMHESKKYDGVVADAAEH